MRYRLLMPRKMRSWWNAVVLRAIHRRVFIIPLREMPVTRRLQRAGDWPHPGYDYRNGFCLRIADGALLVQRAPRERALVWTEGVNEDGEQCWYGAAPI